MNLVNPYRFGAGGGAAQAWDPANKDADFVLSDSDRLATIVSAAGSVRSLSSHAAAGNFYGEVECARSGGGGMPNVLAGIVTAGVSLTNNYPGQTTNSGSTQARGLYPFASTTNFVGQKYSAASGTSYSFPAKTIGVHLNAGVLTFWLGGVAQSVAYSGLTGTVFLAWGPGSSGSATRTGTLRTAGPWKYRNKPATATDWGGTWNSADKSANVTLTGSDLIATVTTGGGMVRGTQGRSASSGEWYAEIDIGGVDTNSLGGIANSSASLSTYPGGDANGWAYYAFGNQKFTGNSGTSNYQSTQVIGLQLTAGSLSGWVDGHDFGAAYSGLTDVYFLAFGPFSASGTFTGRINTGQADFAYGLPSGASAWG